MSVNRKERISIKPKLNSQEVEDKISFETKLWLYPCYFLTFSYLVVRGYFSSMSEMECKPYGTECVRSGNLAKGVVASNLIMNIILFVMIFKSIYMIKESLNH